jgi:hypothetical protein
VYECVRACVQVPARIFANEVIRKGGPAGLVCFFIRHARDELYGMAAKAEEMQPRSAGGPFSKTKSDKEGEEGKRSHKLI